MATPDTTVSFIRSHGHFATITPDGVLAASDAVWPEDELRGDDRVTEDSHVFPIVDGRVSAADVRAWLGY